MMLDTVAYAVCGVALLVSLLALGASALLARVLYAARSRAGTAGVGLLGIGQLAVPLWLLHRVHQGGFAGWGVGLGLGDGAIAFVLARALLAGASAAARP